MVAMPIAMPQAIWSPVGTSVGHPAAARMAGPSGGPAQSIQLTNEQAPGWESIPAPTRLSWPGEQPLGCATGSIQLGGHKNRPLFAKGEMFLCSGNGSAHLYLSSTLLPATLRHTMEESSLTKMELVLRAEITM